MHRSGKLFLTAALVTGVAVAADSLAATLISMHRFDAALTALAGLLKGASCLVYDPTAGAVDPGKKIKLPELKRGTHFLMLENVSNGRWGFQVASLAKNEKGRKESGRVNLFVENKDDKRFPLVLMASLAPGDAPVSLEKGRQYLVYPSFDGEIMGNKRWASDFVRTVYLVDGKGVKLAFNLMRDKADGARIRFGYTLNSWPGRPENVVVATDPKYDDIFVIARDAVIDPPKRPN